MIVLLKNTTFKFLTYNKKEVGIKTKTFPPNNYTHSTTIKIHVHSVKAPYSYSMRT